MRGAQIAEAGSAVLGANGYFPAMFGLAMAAGQAAAGILASIQAKGEIVVGSKADYAPYGFRDEHGQIVGIEPDLAADLARRLGVKLRIEPVTSANRIQMLEDGKVDVIIATMAITKERSQRVSYVYPAYYASGIAGLAAPGSGIHSEEDLKGKAVCAVKGNYANEEVRSVYVRKDLVIADTVPDAGQALGQGRCAVFVFDYAALLPLKKYGGEKWKNYDLIELPGVDPLPWGIALKLEDRPGPLAKLISKAILDWHTSGWLAEVEMRWLGQNTIWVAGIREKYRNKP